MVLLIPFGMSAQLNTLLVTLLSGPKLKTRSVFGVQLSKLPAFRSLAQMVISPVVGMMTVAIPL